MLGEIEHTDKRGGLKVDFYLSLAFPQAHILPWDAVCFTLIVTGTTIKCPQWITGYSISETIALFGTFSEIVFTWHDNGGISGLQYLLEKKKKSHKVLFPN